MVVGILPTTIVKAWHSISGTVGKATLSVDQLATHTHAIDVRALFAGEGSGWNQWYDVHRSTTGSTGGSQSHTHSLSDITSSNSNNIPPFYSLAYIMRVS